MYYTIIIKEGEAIIRIGGFQMDFLELEKQRYTVRKYKNKPVEEDKLNLILEAGRLAPTAVNYQPQRIIVLDTPESLEKARRFSTFDYDEKYAKITKECINEKGKTNTYFYDSPVALLVCYDKTVCWKHPISDKSSGETDATIVTVHMMLEATSLGLGTAWISYFDSEKAKKLLNLPDKLVPVVMLLLGYADDYSQSNINKKPRRFDLSKTVFFNKYHE